MPKDLNTFSQDLEAVSQAGSAAGQDLSEGMDKLSDAANSFEHLKSQIKAKTSASAGSYGSASIIGKAKQNIFEFPVFVSSSVALSQASAVNVLLEQIYASYLQMAISMNPIVDEKDVKRGKVFHRYKTDTIKYLEYADTFYQKDAAHNVIKTDDAAVEFDMVTIDPDEMKILQESLNYEPLSEFDHYFQEAAASGTSNTPKPKTIEKKRFDDAKEDLEKAREEYDKADGAREHAKSLYESAKSDDDRKQARAAYQQATEVRDDARKALTKAETAYDKAWTTYQKSVGETKDRQQKQEDLNIKRESQRLNRIVDTKVKAPQLIDESKIQKLNTLKPLMMNVGVKVMKDGQVSNMIDYVVGVKTHCRIVKAEILPDVVAYPTQEMNKLSKKAKWRAGEIKFLDYLFSRPEKKQAAYDSKDPNRKWYHRLYTLAHSKGSSKVAKQVSGTKSSEGLIPNAAIVMSKADVTMIENEKGIDLMKGSTAAAFCKELFLMALVIVDTDGESVKVLLPEVSNEYDVQTIASINRQVASLDTTSTVSNEIKKLMSGR